MNDESRTIGRSGGGDDLLLRWGLLLSVILGCSLLMARSPADPDLWGHIQYGRDLMAERIVPATTSYSYTAEGYRWVNHENLAEVFLALLFDTFGLTGLLVAKFTLGLVVTVLIIATAARQKVSIAAFGAIAILTAANLAHYWILRPQLLTFVYFSVLLVMLSWCFRGWENRWWLWGQQEKQPALPPPQWIERQMRLLWFSPVLFFFWANSHGGFVAGFCIFVLYLFARCVELLVQRGRAGLKIVGQIGFLVTAAGLATLVNPYGPRLHLWLMQTLSLPRPEINEWAPPQLFQADALPLWLLLITLAACVIFSRRQRDLAHLLILGVTVWQALEHMRHVALLALLFAFWMPTHLESVFNRVRNLFRDKHFARRPSPLLRVVVIGCLCVVIGLQTAGVALRLSDMRVVKSQYPVSAIQFMHDRGLTGRLVVTYNWAQYAIAALGATSPDEPSIRVGFDGRFRTCYPQEIVDMHFDLITGNGGPDYRYRCANSPPFDPTRVLHYRDPDLVLISRRQKHSTKVMQSQQEEWTLLYQDDLAQLWGLKSRYDHPQSSWYLPPKRREISDERQLGSVTWPALPVQGSQSS